MEQEKIDRIGELGKKAKAEGLTPEEEKERDALRKEYVASVRANMKKSIERITIVDEQGNETKIKKKGE